MCSLVPILEYLMKLSQDGLSLGRSQEFSRHHSDMTILEKVIGGGSLVGAFWWQAEIMETYCLPFSEFIMLEPLWKSCSVESWI